MYTPMFCDHLDLTHCGIDIFVGRIPKLQVNITYNNNKIWNIAWLSALRLLVQMSDYNQKAINCTLRMLPIYHTQQKWHGEENEGKKNVTK